MSNRRSSQAIGSLVLLLALFCSLGSSVFAFNAVLSGQNLSVDEKNIDCEKYNIDGSNYFKLRDLAYLVNGTGSQFSVGWDQESGTVSIKTGEGYSPNGTELIIGADQSGTAQVSSQTIMVNGTIRDDLTVYNIGGNNYFQLRELGNIIGFQVDYNGDTNTAIVRTNSVETSKQTPSGIRPEFKEMMDGYEFFMTEYADFMDRYHESDDFSGWLSEYTKMLERYAEWVESIEAVDEGDMSMEELIYYLEVLNRVNQRLAETNT